MKTYRITSKLSGADLGTYEAEDELGALDAMARDAGYADYREVEEITSGRDDLRVVEVEG